MTRHVTIILNFHVALVVYVILSRLRKLPLVKHSLNMSNDGESVEAFALLDLIRFHHLI